jgi:hypothetical protein
MVTHLLEIVQYAFYSAEKVVVPLRVAACCRRLDLDVVDAALELAVL